jgi:hypothetical protein
MNGLNHVGSAVASPTSDCSRAELVYQDFALLIEARNTLLHTKLDARPAGPDRNKASTIACKTFLILTAWWSITAAPSTPRLRGPRQRRSCGSRCLFPPPARRFVELLRLSDVRLNVARHLLDLRHVDLVVSRRHNRPFRVRNTLAFKLV